MFKYTPRQIPSKIVVIGCGGTGSRLVPMLVQFIRSITREFNPTGWLENPEIILIDDDAVEHKNLLRQNFIESDVGKNKAIVLAQRYSRHFGINVNAITQRVQADSTIQNLTGNTHFTQSPVMYIMCVDSSNARRYILDAIERSTRCDNHGQSPFIIDAGNENNYGQVKFFNMATWYGYPDDLKRTFDFPQMLPMQWDVDFIPYPYRFYRDLEDAPSQGSCADLDQTLAINAAMATTIMGVVQNFYYVKPFTHNEVSISLDGAGFTTFNTVANFRSRCTQSTNNRCGVVDAAAVLRNYHKAVTRELEKMELARQRAAREEAERLAAEKAREDERLAAEKAMAEGLNREVEVVEATPVKKPSRKAKEVVTLDAIPLPEAPPLQQVSRG